MSFFGRIFVSSCTDILSQIDTTNISEVFASSFLSNAFFNLFLELSLKIHAITTAHSFINCSHQRLCEFISLENQLNLVDLSIFDLASGSYVFGFVTAVVSSVLPDFGSKIVYTC